MRVATRSGSYESRAFSPGGSFTWNDSLNVTGLVPPHGFSTLQRAGVNIIEGTVTQTAPVNRSLDLITNAMLTMGNPQPNTLAYDKDDYPYHQPIAPIPPVLLNTWGPHKTQSEGMTELVYSLGLFGEAFLYAVTRDDMGDPTGLVILPAPFVEVKSGPSGPLYVFKSGGTARTFSASEITHIRLNPRPGQIRARTAMESEALGMAVYLAAMEYGLQFFGQGIHSSFVLTTDNHVTDELSERVLDQLIVNHAGLSMAHLPMMFGDGIKPEKFQITPDEAQFLNTLERGADDIATYFGVLPAWVGGNPDNGSWGRSLEEQWSMFSRSTMIRYYSVIQEKFSTLLPGEATCAYNSRRLTRAVGVTVGREIAALRTATVMTPDEIRREYFDMGPSEDPVGNELGAPLASNQTPGSDSLVAGGEGDGGQ